MKNKKIQPGDVFGDLKVLRYLGSSKWECKCLLCHNTDIAVTGKLNLGLKTKCTECSKKHDKRVIDLTGKILGNWKVLKYIGDRYWQCECLLCHNIYEVRGNSLRDGKSTCCVSCANKNQSKPTEDLTDRVFGDLTVKEYIKASVWKCQCSCGNYTEVRSDKLKSGEISNCGDRTKHDDTLNLKGKTFGDWEVLEYVGNQYWLCKCSCGEERKVHSWTLRVGKSTCCGSPVHKLQHDLKDKRFGLIVAKEYLGNGVWKCECDCGNTINILGTNLVNRSTHSCGCATASMKNIAMLERYGDVSWKKIEQNSQRELWQIQAVNTKEHFQSFIDNLKNDGIETDAYTVSEMLGVTPEYIYALAKRYNISESILIGRYGVMENEVANLIAELCPDNTIIRHDKTQLNGLELDIYLPDRKLAIEFNGNYWHSSLFKDIKYHQNKTIACIKRGIRLIHIYEYEWTDLKQKIKLINLIKNALNIDTKVVYARKVKVMAISNDTCAEFLENYHLQGSAKAKEKYGAYLGDELIGVATFGISRFNTGSLFNWELIRLCWKPGYRVIGGFRKFLKQFIRDYEPSTIISYCDVGKFSGESYLKAGFKTTASDLSNPGYIWLNRSDNRVLTRYRTMKHILINEGYGHLGSTEDEIMKARGYIKIYNSGNLKFTLNCRE